MLLATVGLVLVYVSPVIHRFPNNRHIKCKNTKQNMVANMAAKSHNCLHVG